MSGESILAALASLVAALAVVGGAILWLARLAAGCTSTAIGLDCTALPWLLTASM